MEVLVGCITVKEVELPCLPGEIVIDATAGLTGATDYVIIIADRFGGKDRREITSEVDGSLIIPVTDPEKYNPYAGVYTLEVYTTSAVSVPLSLCGDDYNAVNMRFIHFTGVPPGAVINCNAVSP